MRTTQRRLLGVLAAGACALATLGTTVSSADAAGPKHPKPRHHSSLVPIQLLSFNDFHGNLAPPSGSCGRNVIGSRDRRRRPASPRTRTADAGGVEYLATHLAQARKGHPNSLTVAAGDIIGASPLLSAAFHDEPTIESMNKLGLDVTAVGNHEFDEGYKELQRMADGGCIADGDGANNQNSCPGHKFRGADFDYLAANVQVRRHERDDPAAVLHQEGARREDRLHRDDPQGHPEHRHRQSGVAGPGVHRRGARPPTRWCRVLEAQGRQRHRRAHPPGRQPRAGEVDRPGDEQDLRREPDLRLHLRQGRQRSPRRRRSCRSRRTSTRRSTWWSRVTRTSPTSARSRTRPASSRLLTSASSFGRLFTETNLTYDQPHPRHRPRLGQGHATCRSAATSPRTRRRPALIASTRSWSRRSPSKVHRQHHGRRDQDAERRGGESPLGDLIADAQLADASVVTGGQKPVIAFMNPGGIRADLTLRRLAVAGRGAGRRHLRGGVHRPAVQQLPGLDDPDRRSRSTTLLTQQVTGSNAAEQQDPAGLDGLQLPARHRRRVPVDGSVKLNGEPIDKTATYRIVTNNFLSDGGDGFPAFKGGTVEVLRWARHRRVRRLPDAPARRTPRAR